jgi:hypothetical protein
MPASLSLRAGSTRPPQEFAVRFLNPIKREDIMIQGDAEYQLTVRKIKRVTLAIVVFFLIVIGFSMFDDYVHGNRDLREDRISEYQREAQAKEDQAARDRQEAYERAVAQQRLKDRRRP